MDRHIFLKKEYFPDELPVTVAAYTHRPGQYTPVENLREFWKITMVTGKPVTLFYYGEPCIIPADSVFLSRPDDLTNIQTAAPAGIINLLVLCPFMAEAAAGLPDNEFFRTLKLEQPEKKPPHLFCVPVNAAIRSKIRRIRTELAHTDQCTPAVLQSLLRLLLTDFCRQLASETRKSITAGQVAAVDRYLQTHYREKITLAALAAHTGLSPGYLAEKYKKETGRTVVETLRHLRAARAAELLLEKKYTHRQIRELCGFPDSSSFYRAFRRVYRTTPDKYLASAGADLAQ